MRRFAVFALIMSIVAASAVLGQEVADFDDALSQEEGESRPTLFNWSSDAPAQGGPPGWDEPLASDRPDFTEASTTVGRGVRQLEFGYTFARDDNGATQTNSDSMPETLLRIGAYADWLEFRVAWNYAAERVTTSLGSNETSGAEDLYLGLKLGLTLQQGWLPEMALMPQMTVPTGGPASSGRVLPGLNWLYGWEINDFISTAGSTQVNLAVDGVSDDEYLEVAQSWTIGYSLTEKLGAYTEWFVLAPAGAESERTQHYFDAGFTYSVTNDFQLDVRAGKGVSAAAVDMFVGAGAVVRF